MKTAFPKRIHVWSPILFAIIAILFTGCLVRTSVKNLSGRPPFDRFVGKTFVTLENGSLWTNSGPSYAIRRISVRFGSAEIPAYETRFSKVTDFPVGTHFLIQAIKHKKVESEMMGSQGDIVLCRVVLLDGRKFDCQMGWSALDPRMATTASFESVEP